MEDAKTKGLRETFGDQHPYTLNSISDLEMLLEDMGDLHATTE